MTKPRHPYEILANMPEDVPMGTESVESSRLYEPFSAKEVLTEKNLPEGYINPHAVKDSMSKEEAIGKLSDVLLNRGDSYGTAKDNHDRASALINTYLKGLPEEQRTNLSATQSMILMILIKVARLEQTPEHVDSFLDIAGYAICAIDAINDGDKAV